MAGIYIKSVTAYGVGKRDAIVEFTDGLNIITGYSDTGKTCIARCIEYVFGSDMLPFDESTGYEGVKMTISSCNGDVTLDRSIGKKSVVVTSLNPDINSDTYSIDYNKNQKKPVLNNLLLSLIGINEEHKVPSNKKFEKKRLTWKTLRSLRFIDEDNIGRTGSIIEPTQYVEKTLFLSSLLFLITGRDFSEVDAQHNKELKQARRKAIEEYVGLKIKSASDKQKELSEMLNYYNDFDLDAELQNTIKEIQSIESDITCKANRGRFLMSSIVNYDKKLLECIVLIERFESLASQYKSDIRRLTFIVDGEKAEQNIPVNKTCPFCDGKITLKKQQSYVTSAKAELKKIISQLNELEDSIKVSQDDKLFIQSNIEDYQKEYDDIQKQLSELLRPRLAELSKIEKSYRRLIEINNEINVYNTLADDLVSDLRELSSEENDDINLEYHPREYFDDDFIENMDYLAKKILEECNYENLLTARFNLQDFDIEVNGGKKSTTRGKGYRAFLNTVVSLMFREYMSENAVYYPNTLIIDTPLLGLDQGVDEAAPESMRTSLFEYFMRHQDNGQLIVIENWKTIPKLDYEKAGANVIKFMKGRTTERYGFLHDVK